MVVLDLPPTMPSSDGSKTQKLPGDDDAPSRSSSTETATGRRFGVLPENEAFLEAVIDNLPVAMFVKDADADFRFVLWNKKQEEVTTIRKEKALGKQDRDLFSKDSADYFREVDESVVRRGKMIDVPEEIVDSDAGEIWLHTVKVPIRDERGGRNLIVGISEDITERVRAREQLEKLNKNLSEKNRELEATQLQLIQAEKMESIGRLAAGVAHEVKNPLALLLMGVEYLSSGVDPDDPNIEEILSEMREAINRADKIIRGLVDFSSERQLALELTDFPPLIEQSLLLVRHELTKGGVNVDIEFEKDTPKVMIDSAKFEQVLVNLFINATHAMAKTSRPKLEVRVFSKKLEEIPRDEGARTADHLRSGDEVVILEVKDNGCGISDEHLQKIFDPFFTTKATGIGTGLGLSVVRKIIELHGGTISLRNRLLGGVSVKIILKVPKTGDAH